MNQKKPADRRTPDKATLIPDISVIVCSDSDENCTLLLAICCEHILGQSQR